MKSALDFSLRVRWAFETSGNVTHLQEEFAGLPDKIKFETWAITQNGGQNDRPFARFVHMHFGLAFLDIFKDGIPSWIPCDWDKLSTETRASFDSHISKSVRKRLNLPQQPIQDEKKA